MPEPAPPGRQGSQAPRRRRPPQGGRGEGAAQPHHRGGPRAVRAQAPGLTPGGLPVPAGPRVNTLEEGLSLAAAGLGAMLLCRSTADHHAGRDWLAFVPVRGLPASELGLVRHRAHPSAPAEAFALAVSETAESGRKP
ncbi:LysR substrate-binding domain-containing protein [Streptomyces sp. NPDC090022]|uniref:LysR substrate-binding domain-containing protein n=1 Tax=Streptomyces sp. NPDC090022 TaxID=3365920 RepID=UPI003830AEBD